MAAWQSPTETQGQTPPARDGAPAAQRALSPEAEETLELIRLALHENDPEGARELLHEAVAALVDPAAGEEKRHIAFLLELDRLAEQLGGQAESKRLRESVLRLRMGILPEDHHEVLAAKLSLAGTRYALGDIKGASQLCEEVLEARTRLLPPNHHDLLMAKQNLALTRNALGDLDGARELFEEVLEAWTRLLPTDHPSLLATKQNLAVTRKALGDLRGARELEEEVHEARTRLLHPDHPDLLKAKGNLAGTRRALGNLEGARELFEEVLEAWSRLLPTDHADLLQAKLNLGSTKAELGDIKGAHELFEEVLEAWSRLLPTDHPNLLATKQGLALTREALGDIKGARELKEEVLEVRARLLPPEHPDLLKAKGNLAMTRKALGDLKGARELEEEVLEVWARLLPPDHFDLLQAKENLAGTRHDLGDIKGAQELFEAVLAAYTRLLPPDHPHLPAAKLNLASTRQTLGDLEGARELEEEALEAWTRLFPPDHPDIFAAKLNLAVTRKELRDLTGAKELEEDVLAGWTGVLPPDHPLILTARQNLAETRKELGDLQGARELVSSLLDGARLRARALRAEAARPAREGARAELGRLFAALCLSSTASSRLDLERELFATLENLRLASVGSAEAAHVLLARPELAELVRDVAETRARLNDLAAAGARDEASVEGWRRELLELAEERDRAERELRGKLADAGAFVGEIDAKSVAARLATGAAVASYLRYPRRFEKDPETGETPPSVGSLLAFVLKPDATVHLVELGAASDLETLVTEWRAALGRPLESRGVGAAEAASSAERLETLGARLRERILDPIRAEVPGLSALHVVLDDLLFLLPLDALPLEDKLVGERIRIQNEVTLARLLRNHGEVAADGGLTAAGGIDYEAELGAGALVRLDTATPPVDSGMLRSGAAAGFVALPETSGEATSIAALYGTAFEREASLYSGSAATKAALFAAAPKTRFLHLATHGWFASERFKSQLDSLAEQGSRDAFRRAEETLTGFAPETLCGLALAGANRGKDSLGRVPGILTAEELASFDLRNCELAVLSACETNVGIRRAGQGIQSLQTALHAAGARTAITSLWKVDDAATRRLFELFYTKLWKDKLGKADALWQAKMALRAEGHPLRDWAGWVLSGEPE